MQQQTREKMTAMTGRSLKTAVLIPFMAAATVGAQWPGNAGG